MAEIGQDDGDIESLPSRKDLFGEGAVDLTCLKVFHTDDIINRWIESKSINHFLLLLLCQPPDAGR
jgi:hypothetical protein